MKRISQVPRPSLLVSGAYAIGVEEELDTPATFPSSSPRHSGNVSKPIAAESIWQGAWSRETWDNQAIGRLAILFVILAVCSWLGIILSRQSEGVATIWLTNG